MFGTNFLNFSSQATRRRTKSKSIFADEDVLFGTNEDDPSVDLFGSSNPTQPNKVRI